MISVIVTIYKQLDNLHLVLLGLNKQTYKNFEVIIAEDDDSEEIKSYIDKARKQYDFKINHVSQKDKGFRRSKILNKAIEKSQGEYVIFLDGDCIPHEKFIETYNKYLTPEIICIGRRCYLNKRISQKLLNDRNLKKMSLFNILSNADHLENGFYNRWSKPFYNTKRTIVGCNWGIHRSSLIEINGFDEDYEGWGCEDKDIDWRLRALNKLTFINIKHKAIVYHLYHKISYNEETQQKANDFLKKKIAEGYIACKNGIKKN